MRRNGPLHLLRACGIALCTALLPALATAQPWPSKPVRIVVGYPPGGGTNTVARLLAEHMSKSLGQQVVVENRPGAGGRIGTQSVVRSDPDGYTLMFASDAELTIAQVTVKALPYDPLKDLAPIALAGRGPYVLVTYAGFAPNTLAELIAYARANPDKVNFGSFGKGSQNHMIDERFKAAAGISTVHVPYKGSGPVIADLAGGQVQYTFATPGATLPLVKAGKLKVLAVAASQRLARADTIPTMAEAGMPGFTGGSWYGLLAPAGTPAAVVERLHAEVVAAFKSADFRRTLDDLSILPVTGTPAELSQLIRSETDALRQLAARIGLEPE
ncbi:MAG: tripartite tricarboxylate transporter substrate binding protein [Proteobacteria bacterium]|nr:tripartite tricarboxylate transporter substrate binding protein [Pseudomonadota bacterium]